jgi:hypothetical protein
MASEQIPDWLARFDGEGLQDKTELAATTDAQGWPHMAYLSAGEILARSGRVSLALWPSSQTAANLQRSGQAILHVGADGVVWEARLRVRPRGVDDDGRAAIFDGEVEGVRRHAAPYADVVSLVSFRLHDPAATLHRWTEKLAELQGSA